MEQAAFMRDFPAVFSQNNTTASASASDSASAKTIDLQQVAKWLQVRKATLIATLRSTYQEHTDYSVESRKVRPGRGGGLNKVVMLTVSCFKRLCMQSRAKNADAVRGYLVNIPPIMPKVSGQVFLGGIDVSGGLAPQPDVCLKAGNVIGPTLPHD